MAVQRNPRTSVSLEREEQQGVESAVETPLYGTRARNLACEVRPQKECLASDELQRLRAVHIVSISSAADLWWDRQHLLVPILVGALELLEDCRMLQSKIRILRLVLGEVGEVLAAAPTHVLPVALARSRHVLRSPEDRALELG